MRHMNTMGIAPDMLRYVRIARVCGINVPEVSELGGRVREAVQLNEQIHMDVEGIETAL